MSDIKTWVVERLKEPSTKRGFVVILTAVLAGFNPEMREAILALGISVFGILEVILKDPVNK